MHQDPNDAANTPHAQAHAARQAYAIPHPVEAIQKNWLADQFKTKTNALNAIYGHALPLSLKMEAATLGQCKRLPCHNSNFLGLNTLLNRDETIEYEDFLNRECNEPPTSRASGVAQLAHPPPPRAAADTCEVETDMRALLERTYGVEARSFTGPRLGSGGGSACALPRAGVASRKDMC